MLSMRVNPRVIWSAMLVALTMVAWPGEAGAQWHFAGYAGVAETLPANVAIDVPAAGLSVTFHDVHFEGRSFSAPVYYGWRFGRTLGDRRRYGLEFEFIHMKAIAETARTYDITAERSGAPPQGTLRMDALVERYAMTHGLNFLLGNAVVRQRLGERVSFDARFGAGVTLPHAESRILGTTREQYEYGGFGAHVAAGVNVRLVGPVSALAEYKLTYAHPEIDIAGGTGRTTTVTHHLAFGASVRLSR